MFKPTFSLHGRLASVLVTLTATLNAGFAYAGPYSDSLGKCLVEATTTADKNALVKWMFATVALHPAVKSVASITDAERAESSRNTARLFEKLLSESCRPQAYQAAKYEGAIALETSFQLLGKVAVRELFMDPSVANGLADLDKHIDKKKMEQVFSTPN